MNSLRAVQLFCALLPSLGSPVFSFAQSFNAASAESASIVNVPVALGAALIPGTHAEITQSLLGRPFVNNFSPSLRNVPGAPLRIAPPLEQKSARVPPFPRIYSSSLLNLGRRIQPTIETAGKASAEVAAELDRHWDGSLPKNGNIQVEPIVQVTPVSRTLPGQASGTSLRSIDNLRQLKLGTYNVLNLFEKVGKHVPDSANPGRLKRVSPREGKAEWHPKETARVILENDLDIAVLQEVENIAAIEDFNNRFLSGRYRTFIIQGNDERGIQIAFLVKKDLPFDVEYRSHKSETWVDPLLGGPPRFLFSRDLPALIVRASGQSKPLFIVFGTHYKSKRTRLSNDPESNTLRTSQVERTVDIIERYRKEFGADTPIMLAGDFNGQMNIERTYTSLHERAGLIDSFDTLKHPPSSEDRVTHTYHPHGGPRQAHQMDAILVSESLGKLILSASVYRYRDAQGRVKPLPRTFEERSHNPSDHFPVIVTLDFPPLIVRIGTKDISPNGM